MYYCSKECPISMERRLAVNITVLLVKIYYFDYQIMLIESWQLCLKKISSICPSRFRWRAFLRQSKFLMIYLHIVYPSSNLNEAWRYNAITSTQLTLQMNHFAISLFKYALLSHPAVLSSTNCWLVCSEFQTLLLKYLKSLQSSDTILITTLLFLDSTTKKLSSLEPLRAKQAKSTHWSRIGDLRLYRIMLQYTVGYIAPPQRRKL